jgi:hypothetical protein
LAKFGKATFLDDVWAGSGREIRDHKGDS